MTSGRRTDVGQVVEAPGAAAGRGLACGASGAGAVVVEAVAGAVGPPDARVDAEAGTDVAGGAERVHGPGVGASVRFAPGVPPRVEQATVIEWPAVFRFRRVAGVEYRWIARVHPLGPDAHPAAVNGHAQHASEKSTHGTPVPHSMPPCVAEGNR